MSGLSDIGSSEAGLAGGIFDQINHYADKFIDQNLTQENMRYAKRQQWQLNNQMARLSEDARQRSAVDMVSGLRAAGLSPALAQGTSFGSVSSSSAGAPLGVPTSQRSNFAHLAMEQARYVESEQDLLQSQANLNNANAEKINLENKDTKGKNAIATSLINDELDFMLIDNKENSRAYAWAKAIKDSVNGGGYTIGALQSIRDFLATHNSGGEFRVKELTYELQKKVLDKQVYDEQLVNLLSTVPKEQAMQIQEVTSQLITKSSILMAQLDNTNAETENMKEQREVIKKTAQQLDTLIRATHHKDLISMWEDGEYMSAAFGTGMETIKSIGPLDLFLLGKGIKGIGNLKKSPSVPGLDHNPNRTFMEHLND